MHTGMPFGLREGALSWEPGGYEFHTSDVLQNFVDRNLLLST